MLRIFSIIFIPSRFLCKHNERDHIVSHIGEFALIVKIIIFFGEMYNIKYDFISIFLNMVKRKYAFKFIVFAISGERKIFVPCAKGQISI